MWVFHVAIKKTNYIHMKNNLFYIGLKVVILSQRIFKGAISCFIRDFDSALNVKYQNGKNS